MSIHEVISYRRTESDFERVTLYVAVRDSECSPAYEFRSLALACAYMEGWL